MKICGKNLAAKAVLNLLKNKKNFADSKLTITFIKFCNLEDPSKPTEELVKIRGFP